MLDLTKPMQHKDGRKVLLYHLVPEWLMIAEAKQGGQDLAVMLSDDTIMWLHADGRAYAYHREPTIINVPEPTLEPNRLIKENQLIPTNQAEIKAHRKRQKSLREKTDKRYWQSIEDVPKGIFWMQDRDGRALMITAIYWTEDDISLYCNGWLVYCKDIRDIELLRWSYDRVEWKECVCE